MCLLQEQQVLLITGPSLQPLVFNYQLWSIEITVRNMNVAAHGCNPSSWQVEAGGSLILCHMRSLLKVKMIMLKKYGAFGGFVYVCV